MTDHFLVNVPMSPRECGLVVTLLRNSARDLAGRNDALANDLHVLASTVEASVLVERTHEQNA